MLLDCHVIFQYDEIKGSCDFMSCFFSVRIFFHRHWRLKGQQGKGGDHLLFHSITSTRSRTFRHLFATLHVSGSFFW